MNSFFATVEQQANPTLRGKPIAVGGGRSGKRKIAIAASIEAKKKGVKTAMGAWDAEALCPDLIWIPADHHKYTEVARKFLRIFRDFTPEIEIFSVDEAFLDLTHTLQLYPSAKWVGEQIKQRLRADVGEWMKCSIGIAPNKFLAKLASDTFKPDALIEIKPGEHQWLLDQVELEDFCGIGRRIHRRLNQMGIWTVKDLAAADPIRVRRSLGINGLKMHWAANGFDPTPLDLYYARKDVQSMGHQTTLPENTWDPKYLDEMWFRLSEQVGRRLRQGGYKARWLSMWVRYAEFTSTGRKYRFAELTNDTYDIFMATRKMFKTVRLEPIRLVGLTAHTLTKTDAIPISLWEEDRQKERTLGAMDAINDRWGEFTITRGLADTADSDRQLIAKHFGNKRIEF